MIEKGINQFDQKQQNTWLVKKHLYLNSPISRVEIAHNLGLTTPVITSIVSPLLAEGVVRERETGGTDANKGAGRRRIMIEFNPESHYACGVDLRPRHTNYVLTDLCGKPVAHRQTSTTLGEYQSTIEHLAEEIPCFLQECGVEREKILGVCVTMPGLIDSSQGKIYTTFHQGWTGCDPAGELCQRIGYPVMVENNVRAKATGAEMFDRMVQAQPFAYLSVSHGIACQMIIDNKFLYGNSAAAGEIGHMVVQRGGPFCATCGNRGCLEALSGERAILSRCQEIMALEPDCLLWQLCPKPDKLTMEAVLEAQEQGDPYVGDVMLVALDYLGIALANVVNLLSPGMVVIDGRMFSLPGNQEYLLRAARRNMFRILAHNVQFTFLPYDSYRGARAGAAVVIKKYLHGG